MAQETIPCVTNSMATQILVKAHISNNTNAGSINSSRRTGSTRIEIINGDGSLLEIE